eukprot:CAMPEP_0197692290 /NCGR_PEP_ID=MMETSP1338-20131121/110870_1 /TAXON_ID=43686 ORGANISM="Pelagodinium beii, Strain RCC1491" /NCGR_SAMPLE_ID=MMETSP1338 /ASSEMBLY_ACC=CAM_ASM_000754 /LENGTH=53 /DNA_ID=CAMNT_0043274927 /DNA_START=100 /DNA_END=261 /DNA_ORIENTATION=+
MGLGSERRTPDVQEDNGFAIREPPRVWFAAARDGRWPGASELLAQKECCGDLE